MGVDTRVSRLMLQVGLMCLQQKRWDDAERIIRSVKTFRDDVPLPGTTLALMFMFQNRLPEAIAELDAVLLAFPNHQMGRAVLGIVHRRAGTAGWERILQQVVDDGRDEFAIRLARQSLPAPLPKPGGARAPGLTAAPHASWVRA